MSQIRIDGSTSSEIASSIERHVHSGMLAEGTRLPTIRELAASLRVSPVTVTAAYRLLQTRGLIVGGRRRGTHVRAHPSAQATAARAAVIADGVIDLATGSPDPELLPSIAGALRGLEPPAQTYGDPSEFRPLVSFAAAEFEADGIPGDAVTVTNGALDAVERVLHEHIRPGDRVVVEDPTLPALIDLLASRGASPHPCPIDDEGFESGPFERVVASHARAVILCPRAQNPTGAAISARRAADLARILRRRPQMLVIEIDAAGPISGAAPVTLIDASRAHWAVIRSTSKFLGPDLRVAVIASDTLTAGRVQRRQSVGVRWVSHLLQSLTLALWSDPSGARRLARAAGVYRERRVALLDALATHGIAAHGQSGLNVWIPVQGESAIVGALAARGWAVAAGERFRLRSQPAIRVTTSALVPAEAKRLAADLADIVRPHTSASA